MEESHRCECLEIRHPYLGDGHTEKVKGACSDLGGVLVCPTVTLSVRIQCAGVVVRGADS